MGKKIFGSVKISNNMALAKYLKRMGADTEEAMLLLAKNETVVVATTAPTVELYIRKAPIAEALPVPAPRSRFNMKF